MCLLVHGIYGYIPPSRPATYIPFTVSPLLMQRYLYPVLCFIVGCVLLSAGCTSPSGTPAGTLMSVTPSPAGNISLTLNALAPADLPTGFVAQSARYKSADEVSSTAKDLGWQEGYVSTWTAAGNGTAGATTITQTITVYNAQNMSSLVPLVAASEQQQQGVVFSTLPQPATGPDTRAISAVVVNTTPAAATSGGFVAIQNESTSAAAVRGYIEVIFGKGQILEVIRMTGPGAQYDTLKTLAESAYAKLG
jgi:hypothetical protein